MKKMQLSFVVVLLAVGLLFGSVSRMNAQTLPAGLVAAYGFNEGSGSTTSDASGMSNTGTISGATWTTSGRFGNALSFNGSSNRVNINDANSLDLTTGMTLEAWVYPTSLSGWRSVILKEQSGGLTYALYAYDNAPQPAAYINTGGSDLTVAGTASIPLNAWTHLATTYDGASFKLYVNGSQVGSKAISGAIKASTNPLTIGGNSVWGEYFSGRIDEVRIYNRAISQVEIQTDMNTSITVLPPDTTPPTAPANLSATAAGSSQINLSWTAATDNVGVTGYLIERCQGTGCSTFTQIATTTTTTYNNTGLQASTSYSYRVRATDAVNNLSLYSNTSSATTPQASDTTPPTAPANLSATAAGSSQINLSWTAATDNVGVTGYLIERCQGTGCSTFTQIATTTTTTYNNTGLQASTSYSYRVRATDAVNNLSLYSNTSSATTPQASDTTPPTAPANLSATAAGSSQINLSWTAATDNVGVTGYLIERCQGTGCSAFTQIATTATTTYNNAGLQASTSYSYRVRATDAANNLSPYSSTASTLTLTAGVEPAGWYAGDMHVHRSCGGSPEAVSSMFQRMTTQNLSVMSLLADMGDGEVQNPVTDLPLVTGNDASISTPGQILHWDAEWHWDPAGATYPHKVLGGHIVSLGLTEAHQISTEEYTYPILNWAHQQNGIAGFAHMQYLDNSIPQSLSCCTPIEYPVEVALGSADFISEDDFGSDSVIQAYYRLLNTGFRPGFAAGTDYPCNNPEVGNLLTYVQVAGGQMTYRNWIDGIAKGRTVVSRNGHNEFLNLIVNNSATPGDEIKLTGAGSVPVTITWTANQNLSGTIELVQNGVVIASQQATVSSGVAASLSTTVDFTKSGWLAARRMNGNGHQVHTGAVFVTLNNSPVRASVADADFYVQWMDNLLTKTSPGGVWNQYFPTNLAAAQARYQAAKALYQQIALEAGGQTAPLTVTTTSLPGGAPNVAYSALLAASGGVTPYTWSISSGSLPPGLTLNASTGVIAGTPTTLGTFSFTARVTDTASQATTKALSIVISTASDFTIWPGTTAPGLVDGGPDSSVELGVKFRSDSNGAIKGIRFYKASTNTGTHIANLWTSTGTKLATATFTGETASGWQQVLFTSPVTITANTVYVASYHANSGHYSADVNYFAASGKDSPPLHALANGVSGGNGVYTYGSTSSFPNQTWSTANYWVDVVFSGAAPATLSSIAVTPASQTISAGATQQFSAIGTYSDGSTQNLTSQATWSSLNTNVATITSAGFASAVNPGSTTISATLGSVTGGTTLTVQATPLTITTTSLPGGTQNVSYSALLAASGGTVPYTWSIVGSLPTGLSLNTSTGVISGMPSATGTFSFTVQVTDLGNPVQSVTKTLSITVSAAPVLTITTAALPGGTLNVAYSATLAASGGTSPFTWSIVGSLPAGLSLNTSTGVISGTPESSGAIGFNAQVTDSSNPVQTTTKAFSIGIDLSGPILIISSSSNPFSTYYAEILRAEGLNAFAVNDIASVSSTVLASYDVVVLGEMALTFGQVTMLSDWVNAGGHLIAMHPDKQLAGLLGLTDLSSTISDAYLLVNTSSGPGAGIVSQTIQFHGTADCYSLSGASNVATLYSNATTSISSPAVALNNVGSNGGQAAAFTYDLARSVVYTRQGNPAWAGQNRDVDVSPVGDTLIRSDDLFYPDWVDLNKVAIPQADEQQRLLANLIIQMNFNKKPLPRFWYLPRNLPAAVVMTGDDHNGNGTAGRFDAQMAMGPSGCSVANWECIRSTSYIYPDNGLTNSQAAVYSSAGFEIATHITTNCADWTFSSLGAFFSDQLQAWSAKYTSLPSPVTNRTHCIAWSDYASQPVIELAHGIGLDANYYYWPPNWINDRPGLFTGSGMPMRFADSSGNLINVYQATTQMTDESGQSYPYTSDTLLDRAIGPEGYYGVFTANAHTDTVTTIESSAIVNSARARGIPVVSARQMLDWLDGRNASTFNAMSWNGNTLSFSINAGQGTNGLTAMAPIPAGQTVSSVTANGSAIPYTINTVKGVTYARFQAATGAYQVSYALDIIGPTVSAVTPANGASGISTGSTVTVTLSEAIDTATISSNSFELRDASNALVSAAVTYNATTWTATITPTNPLANSTIYYATVKGGANGVKDLAGNPLAGDFTWSFTTSAVPAGPYSIWPGATVPGLADSGPDSAVELGVKFRADSNGSITGIRFYKAGTNTGTHVANLWTSTGTKLATATFTNETASGWQQVSFSTPVAITANTVYVASYHSTVGHYSDDMSYFAGKGADSPPLHALADGVSSFNGVFAYGSTSNFPNNGWNSSNYWVDVVFQP